MEIGNLIIRPFQLFFVAVILGLSIELAKEQVQHAIPSITIFSIVCGIIGAVALFVGLAAVFVERLQGLIMVVLDGVATLFFLAGSIALAAQLGVHSCTSRPADWNSRFKGDGTPPNPYCAYNNVIAGGAINFSGKADDLMLDVLAGYRNSWFVKRCRMAQALDAFLFFALAAFAGSLVFDALRMRRK